MFSSPAKRRKLSSISTDAFTAAPAAEDPARQSAQSTPRQRRASFQSPTKASLARFNPGLVPRSGSRSPGKQRVDIVGSAEAAGADEIRRKRVALFEKLVPASDTKENEQPRSENIASEGERVKQGATISQPPRRRSLSPIKFDTRLAEVSLPQGSMNFESRQRAQELDNTSTTNEAPPHQADRMGRLTAPVVLMDEGEPELPPTPVELGWEAQAPPPSGMLSSSPSSGSSRRKKRKASEGVKSSPLKLRDQRPDSPAQLDVDGVPFPSLRPKQPHFSEEIVRKQRLRDELAAQLERLKGEVDVLEKEIRGDRAVDDLFEDPEDTERELISLLTTSNPACAPAPPPPPKPATLSTLLHAFLPFAPAPPPPSSAASPTAPGSTSQLKLDNVSELPYLTLFTPLLLSSTTTTTTSPSNVPLQTHTLTLSSPAPFKPAHFSATLQLTNDPLTQTVTSLSLTSFVPPHTHAPLHSWITQRLQSPLFALDMPGLGCGIANYWDGCVARALTWKEIEDALPQFVQRPLGSTHDDENSDVGVRNDGIAPYLGQSCMTLRRAGLDTEGKALLITYDLTVSRWTGEVTAELAVCTRGCGRRVEEGVKRAFKGLIRKIGVLEAARGLCEMVLGN